MSTKKKLHLFISSLWISQSFLTSSIILFCGNSAIGIDLGIFFLIVSLFASVSIILDIRNTLENENHLETKIHQLIKLEDEILKLKEGIKLYRRLYCYERPKGEQRFEKDVLNWEREYGVKKVEFPKNDMFFSWIVELLKL